MIKQTLALVGLTLSLSTNAAVIDQSQLLVQAGYGLGSAINNTHVVQQGVTAGISGTLMGFDFQTNDLGGQQSQTFEVFVNVGSPLQTDSNDFLATVTMNSSDVGSFFFVDTSSAGISLSAGDEFSIGLTGLGATLSVGLNNPYTGGIMYFDGVAQTSGSVPDFAFRTHMSPIPIPAAAWLFGSALIGLAGIKRKK